MATTKTKTTTPKTPVEIVGPIPDPAPEPPAGAGPVLVGVQADRLVPDPLNLRGSLTDISDLADSIAAVGLLEPLVVQPCDGDMATAPLPRFQIVAGHRRHAAVLDLIARGVWPKSRKLTCIVNDLTLSAEDRVVAQLVENLQRVDLDPIEEAAGYERLVDAGWKADRIAAATGRPVDRVTGRLRLRKLPAGWQTQVSEGTLTLENAAQLASWPAALLAEHSQSKKAPSGYQINDEKNSWQRRTSTDLARANAVARGIDVSTLLAATWRMEQTHTMVLATTPKALATVLLPDLPDLCAQMIYPYSSAADIAVHIWAPNPDTPATGKDADDPGRAARKAVDDRNRAAKAEWEKARLQVAVEFCRNITAEQMADYAAFMIMDWGFQLAEGAEPLGWVNPNLDDADATDAHLEAWATTLRNRWSLPAAIALIAQHPSKEDAQALGFDKAMIRAGLPTSFTPDPYPTEDGAQ